MKLQRISFALVICALFGMTGCGNVPQTIPDTTSDEPTTTEPTTTEPTWKSIEYVQQFRRAFLYVVIVLYKLTDYIVKAIMIYLSLIGYAGQSERANHLLLQTTTLCI